jgi:hypothetical protein
MKKAFVLLALATGLSSAAQAQSVVAWDFTGDAGNQASEAPVSAAAGVIGGNVTRGSGLAASGAGNSFSSSGWESTGSGASGTEYLSFGFTVAVGQSVDLISLLIGTRSSGTGPGSLGLFYGGDGFASQLYTFTQDNTTDLFSSIDLSALPDLTGSVEFRIYEIGNTQADGSGATASGGTFRLIDHNVLGNMGFTGSVTAVPEPETYAMLLAGLGLVGACTRRRKAQSSQA